MLKLKLQYTWCEELTHWKRPWCWERLKVGRKGDNRGWDSWMASLTGWTWVWANFGSWWWTGKPDVLQFMGWQRVRHDWVTELNWTFFLASSLFVLHEFGYAHFLLVAIHLEYHLSLLHFESIFVFRTEMSLLENVGRWVLFFNLSSHSVSFDWWIQSIYI